MDRASHFPGSDVGESLENVFGRTLDSLARGAARIGESAPVEEFGVVSGVGRGTARVEGLPRVGAEELVRFAGGQMGMVFDLTPEEAGVILLDDAEGVSAGTEVHRTGRILDVPVGRRLLGRVLDALGRPMDGRGPVRASERRAVESDAPAIMDRAPVHVPLETGLKVVDALVPIGRGQRQLIVGDRQTGKTAIAVDTIINQRDKGVISVYCATGQRSSAIARVIETLEESGAMDQAVAIVSTGDEAPGLQFVAPYAAMTIGEYFMEQGHDVLLVLDDLTHHAIAYRELSLLLRRPPGREGFPGDVFYIHSRLLERSTQLRPDRGGGSLTALPIVETEEGNVAAYIPTNLISITDGQIYLSPELFRRGILPAVDVGRSVSRVGGKTQLPAYRSVAGPLRLTYTQFEELEAFARFGARLDPDTRRTIERGRRVREVLKQPQASPISSPVQIAILLALNAGLFDDLDVEWVAEAMGRIRTAFEHGLSDTGDRVLGGEPLDDEVRTRILDVAGDAIREMRA